MRSSSICFFEFGAALQRLCALKARMRHVNLVHFASARVRLERERASLRTSRTYRASGRADVPYGLDNLGARARRQVKCPRGQISRAG